MGVVRLEIDWDYSVYAGVLYFKRHQEKHNVKNLVLEYPPLCDQCLRRSYCSSIHLTCTSRQSRSILTTSKLLLRAGKHALGNHWSTRSLIHYILPNDMWEQLAFFLCSRLSSRRLTIKAKDFTKQYPDTFSVSVSNTWQRNDNPLGTLRIVVS